MTKVVPRSPSSARLIAKFTASVFTRAFPHALLAGLVAEMLQRAVLRIHCVRLALAAAELDELTPVTAATALRAVGERVLD